MTETTHGKEPADIPMALAAPKSRRSVQLVWLIPLLAALIGGWLAVKTILDKGPEITISFKTAEGLEAGKTKLKYKDVEIGEVSSVTLSADRSKVIATADLNKDTKNLLVSDTTFWVVRPRISGGSISGLSTLLSGSYIGVDVGKSKSTKPQLAYIGLEVPPVFSTDAPGREFVLHSPDLGSLDTGSPVFFRRLQVGQITAYALDKDGTGVTLKVFVNAPYDKYVTPNTRFWHASGIDMSLTANGISVQTQSLVSIIVGGLAFETPVASIGLEEAKANTGFNLADTRGEAMKHPDGIVDTRMLVFNESVRGLLPGAPVDFLGIDIGEVVSINTQFDPVSKKFSIPVEVRIYPERIGSRRLKGAKPMVRDPKDNYDTLVAHGMRAQLRTGNLLTGQLYVAFDFFPNAPKAKIDWDKDPVEMLTIKGSLTDLREAATSIINKLNKIDYEAIGSNLQQTLQGSNDVVKKIDKMEFEAIGSDLQQTLQSTNKLMQRLDAELVPETKGMMEDARRALVSAEKLLASDSPLQTDATAMMNEIARAAQSLRILSDYLEQHPEALIKGKKEDGK